MATLDDIANRTGVTMTTVSRVLTGSYVAKRPDAVKRAARIRAVAVELGYRPDASARATRTGRTRCIALLQSASDTSRSYMPQAMIRGLHDAFAKHDHHLSIVYASDETLDDEGGVPKILRERVADGLLINYHKGIPPRLEVLLQQAQIPAIWINSPHGGDCVYPNDHQAGRQLTQHFLDAGLTDIAYLDLSNDLDDPLDHYSGRDRFAGYRDSMHAAQLEPKLLGGTGGPQSADRLERLERWLHGPRPPQAVVAYARYLELCLMLDRVRRGSVEPPAIATFHESRVTVGDHAWPTMVSPHHAVGREAALMILEKLEQPDRMLPPKRVAYGFVSPF